MTKKAYFAGGCFWCTEALFRRIRGVSSVTAGYAGGKGSKALDDVSVRGYKGPAEAIKITYDPKLISYEDLLYIFFNTHDPTTLDKQGADVGPQYRSVVFYVDGEQKSAAEKAKKDAQKVHENHIVTEIAPLEGFYDAEGYHQDYYKNNPNATYCKVVIDPKIRKLKKNFSKYLNESS